MGLDTLVRAFARIHATHPEAQLLIGGSGSLRDELDSLVGSLGVGAAVRFLGYIPDEDLPNYYQAADAFVLPTRELEGFGLVTVEALACGTPVFGTPVGGTPEILQPLDPALIFSDSRPEDLAQTLTAYLSRCRQQPGFRQSLQARCRQHAESFYSWDRHIRDLEDTYTTLQYQHVQASMPPASCPACGGTLNQSPVAYAGRSYLQCAQCGTGRISRLPDPTRQQKHYELEYPILFASVEAGPRRTKVFESLLDGLGSPHERSVLLDIGCGEGHFASLAARRGWNSLGTDISYHACVAAHRSGTTSVQSNAEILPMTSASIDVVTLVNALDHLQDPLATLQEAYRTLRPQGRLIIRIPNASFHRLAIRILSSLGPLPRMRGWDRYPILHLFAFTPTSLRQLVARAGFRILSVQNSFLAAEDPWRDCGWPARAVFTAARNTLGITAQVVDFVSGHRWLVGPSIELCAERPLPGSDVR
jgi:SAM-dependent methyltransferase